MRKLVCLTAVIFALVGASLPVTASERIYVYTENFPPYNMSATGRAFEHNGDDIDGLCTEMVKGILDASGLDYVVKLRNWEFGYNRASQFKWIGPLTKNLWTIFAPPGTDLKIEKLEDTQGMLYAGYRGDVMTEYLLERGYKVSAMDSDDLNPKRLELGQVDLWIADRLAGPYFASLQDVEGLEPVFSFNDTELYLAMNLDTSEEVMRKLRQGLEAIKNNGMYEAIETKYGL